MATMAEMHCIFVKTNLDTRLALLLHKDDHVSAFKDKFCKEHVQCFPSFGEITVSALKVNWQDQHYHLSDSMILSKVFEGNNSEWFIFVDVASFEEKGDPTHEETLQIQAAEEKTKKRKLKCSVSAKNSRKKLAVDPNQSALVDELSGKEIESGEGNGISMGENQKTCDDGLVDGHSKDVKANETLEEAVESDLAMRRESHKSLAKVPEGKLDLDLNKAMEQDLKKGEKIALATADVVMIDQEEDLENDHLLLTAEVCKTTDAENEGSIDGVDATSESLPNLGGEKITNTLVEAKQNGNEKGDNGEKDGDEAKPVKPKKKTKSRKDKTVPKENTLVASTTPNAVLALSALNVEPGNVIKDSQENVKKSSKSSKKKQSENIVEEAQVVSVYAAE